MNLDRSCDLVEALAVRSEEGSSSGVSDYHFRCGQGDDIRTNGQSRIVWRANGSGTMEAVPFNETLLKGETIDDRWGREEGWRLQGVS